MDNSVDKVRIVGGKKRQCKISTRLCGYVGKFPSVFTQVFF